MIVRDVTLAAKPSILDCTILLLLFSEVMSSSAAHVGPNLRPLDVEDCRCEKTKTDGRDSRWAEDVRASEFENGGRLQALRLRQADGEGQHGQ